MNQKQIDAITLLKEHHEIILKHGSLILRTLKVLENTNERLKKVEEVLIDNNRFF